ncbi:MAG: L-seryl-tRNA(Sec) selenium transferase [Deltaproteobacteria bacterium]|nr:MAG: L-seryl-tRNA(Sec) selenium transferase [Deltaproteobacteria bacterium]
MKTAAETPQALLRTLPAVEKLLTAPALSPLLRRYNRSYVTDTVRAVLTAVRQEILAGALTAPVEEAEVVRRVAAVIAREDHSPLRSVVNATGTVLHTNLGRALLAKAAIDEVVRAAATPVTLEYDLIAGGRGDRDEVIEADLLALTGAEGATVVNNNAAAVLLALNTLADGKEAVVSRGELIEIGGSFRIPDVMRKSGVCLREVGTTNRTHVQDYAGAITAQTGVLLKVHPSNYRIIGFTSAVDLEELVALGRTHHVPVMEDLGAGALLDLSLYGLPKEPVVAERVAKGADVVTFSGDKLLGGPQAGLIVGRKEGITRIKQNPLKRALRPGKLTLAALSATLRLYRRSPELVAELPTLRWLTRPRAEMDAVAAQALPLLQARLGEGCSLTVEDGKAQIGSGTLPEEELSSRVIAIRHARLSGEKIAARFRASNPPILGRIHEDAFLLDLRGIFAAEELVPQP